MLCTYCSLSHKATRTIGVAGSVEHVCDSAYQYIVDCNSKDGKLDSIIEYPLGSKKAGKQPPTIIKTTTVGGYYHCSAANLDTHIEQYWHMTIEQLREEVLHLLGLYDDADEDYRARYTAITSKSELILMLADCRPEEGFEW
ncbi:hypothetical protein SEA_WEASELS2_284 [Rhodococcus phage Weasels2]|uniref:Uncharacterized protein n=1 Tax=Rhodococcus phage Weasels2 TaxID=1897437 RepID=A0A1I9SAQ6_9CAUD|nr:hypothetical protein FDH04_gp132 [Rhodococcus phage Weasels2]AOZ63862.1 hypothetical protein SEA_WEASELS2_284 [Rhodococcus phage Weasels2]